MKEFKMTISDLFDNRRSIVNGIRVISKFELTDELLKINISTILSNLREYEDSLDNYTRSNHPATLEYNRILTFLCDDNYGYKRVQICELDEKYYSYEVFYLSPELKAYGLPRDIFVKLANAINDYRNRRGVPLTTNDVCICVSSIGFGGQHLNYMSNNNFSGNIIKTLTNPKKDVAINLSTDITKNYNNQTNVMKITVDYYEGMKEAMDKINNNTFATIQLNGYFPLIYGQLDHNPNTGLLKIVKAYESKFYMEFIGDKMVFYDGKKSYNACLPFISNWDVDMVVITQFTKHKEFFYQPNFPDNRRKAVLHFVNRDRIRSTQISNQGSGLRGEVRCNIGIKKNITYQLMLGRISYLVVPVEPNGASSKLLYSLNKMVMGYFSGHDTMYNNYYQEYRNMLVLGREIDLESEDILSQWFALCTQSTKNADDKILKAYQKMEKDLQTEYKQLGYYINNYDFSKCMPIPKLEIDKKLKNNYYKSLHIEPINVIIDNINKKKIKPIEEIRTIARFACENKGRYIIGELPIQKFYDVKTNTVKLEYNKMKGEVIRDKAKDRR